MPIVGRTTSRVSTSNGAFTTEILIYKKEERMDYQILVGMDILTHATLNLKDRELSFEKTTLPENAEENPHLNIEF